MHLTLLISSLKAGGAERTLSDLANHWVNKGHKVTLLTLGSPHEEPFYPLDPRIQFIRLDKLNEKKDSFFVRLKLIIERIFCIRKVLKRIRPDLIISFIDVMNVTGLLANYNLKIPLMAVERTHPAYHQLPCLYKWLRLLTYRWACKIIVQTQSVADYFPKKLHSQIVVIPNVAKKPMCQKAISSQPVRKIISVGRLCAFKGFDVLIQAFAHIRIDYPLLELIIYGEGKERENLEALISKLNLQEKVYLPGLTSFIDTALSQADLFVFPSYYEGFPNALCEAMSVGLPVIASNCPGNNDIIREGVDGRLFPVGNIKALEKLLVELLEDSTQRQKLSQEALKISNRFCQSQIYNLWDHSIGESLK